MDEKPCEQSFWCPWPESNQHSLRNSILSRARLPIPPQGPSDARRSEVAKPAEYSGRHLAVNPIASSRGGRWSERLPGRSDGKRLDATAMAMTRLRRVKTGKHPSVIAFASTAR